jgi:hypothetical protein
MSERTFSFGGGDVFELRRLDRALAHLARPVLGEEWQTPMTRAELLDLGVLAGGRVPQRRELIARLWSRKRQLLRQAAAFLDWDPQPPVA